jgi:HAD superfamily hydrolase (TIGR01490 family)
VQTQPGPVLAVFDLDGTISRRDTFIPFVMGLLWRHPWRLPRLLLVLPAALAYVVGASDRGALKGALLHHTLGGVSRATIDGWAAEHTRRLLQRGLFPQARAAIETHQAAGDYLVLMSASVDCYVPRLGSALGFDEVYCTQVRWDRNGTLDGRLQGSNLRGETKARQFSLLEARLKPRESVAYGNSRADLLHLQLATRGVYVNGRLTKLSAPMQRISIVDWR